MVPAVTYDLSLDTLYLLEVDQFNAGEQNRLRLSTVTGEIGSEVLTLGTAFYTVTNTWRTREALSSGSAPQLGSPARISCDDSRMQNVVYRNVTLWCAHTVFLPDETSQNPGHQHAAIQWWQLAPTDEGILQWGRINDPVGIVHYAFPSIAVNAIDDVLIGYSRFSPSQYASANYSVRSHQDPTNTLRADSVFKAGEAPYYKTFGSGMNRWGDRSATVVDPVDLCSSK